MVLKQGQFYPLGDTWQYLETVSVVTTTGIWFIEDRDAAQLPTAPGMAPTTKNYLVQMSVVPQLMNPDVDPRWQASATSAPLSTPFMSFAVTSR